MSSRPRTIQIFLPSGDPTGIRVAELTTSIIRMLEVPRSLVPQFLGMPEARQVGLYFLVGGEDSDRLYIGQSGDTGKRLAQHDKDDTKEWSRALVLVSMTNNLTQTHVLYLEALSIEKAKACQRYTLLNGNGGQRPHTPVPLQADCDEIHEIGSLLLATLGYPIFEPLIKDQSQQKLEKFFMTRAGVQAEAYFTQEGLVVLQGSKGITSASKKNAPGLIETRRKLLEEGILVPDGDRVVMTRDYLFKSPSAASSAMLMASSNGWIDWKSASGVTLSDTYRQVVSPP